MGDEARPRPQVKSFVAPKESLQRAGLCREKQLLSTFSRRGRRLKLNRASLAFQSAESAGRPFSIWCSSACRSTCKLRDLKSHAPIPDQGLFCAVALERGRGAARPSTSYRLLIPHPTASFVSRAAS